MTQSLLDAIGEYYVNSGVNLNELAKLFKIELQEIVRLFTRREQLKLSQEIQTKVKEKMLDENKKLSVLLSIALKFRLSLKSICKLDGIENPTSDDVIEMWNRIEVHFMNEPFSKTDPYRYLFSYETVNRPDKYEFSSLFAAKHFIKSLNEETDPEKKSKLISQISKEEREFKDFAKFYFPGKEISLGDINIIEKYRTKYAIKQQDIADMLHIDKHKFQSWEAQVDDEKLLYRIGQLNSYQLDLHEVYKRRK